MVLVPDLGFSVDINALSGPRLAGDHLGGRTFRDAIFRKKLRFELHEN